MQAAQQPSVKNLLISCLVGCLLIVVAGVGLSFYSEQKAETVSVEKPQPVAAVVPPPTELVMLTKTDEVDAYSEQIKGIHESVDNFDVRNHTSTLEDLNVALASFDNWASFIGEGIKLNLSADASAELKALNENVQNVQINSFPILRDQYGPLVRAEFAKAKEAKSAMTVGKGFKKLVFTSSDFKDKALVKELHASKLELLLNLRFEVITYRERKWDDKPTIMNIGGHADDLVVDWTSDNAVGAIGVEQVFSAANHHRPSTTTTAEAETEQ